jgi:hypothetical protein
LNGKEFTEVDFKLQTKFVPTFIDKVIKIDGKNYKLQEV